MLRREDCIFSSEDACSDEKIAFSRRRRRALTRRLRFLVGEGALRREECVFSSERARSDEKMRFLVGARTFRREDGMFSSTNACVDEKITFSRRWLRPPTKRLHFLVSSLD